MWKEEYKILKGLRKQYFAKSLDDCIRCMHQDKHKTILLTDVHLYQVVTRVNFLVIQHWAERANKAIKEQGNKKIDPITRIGWLIMQKNYRRYVDSVLFVHLQCL